MPKSRKDEALDSYLSTAELLEIAGITRKALRVYERDGACAPAVTKSDYYKYWTLEQADEIRQISDLSQSGLSVKEIIAAARAPESSLLELSYIDAVSQQRKDRRRIKSLWLQRISSEARRALLEVGDSWYLRYLPQRWLALVPVWPHAPELVLPGQFIEAYRRLSEVSQVVGWSASPLTGQLASIDESGAGTSYIYLQLANAPMPVPIGRRPADSGCYISASGEVNSPLCSARHCAECALFGCVPSEKALKHWAKAERDAAAAGYDLHDRTVMVDELAEPYLSGAWSVYTKHKLGTDSEAARLGVHGTTLRPRLMPHETALPCGVTACVLPQGFYLCKTCPSTSAAKEFDKARGVLEQLDTEEITEEHELETVRDALRKHETSPVAAAERIGYGFDHDETDADIPLQRGFSREPLAAMLSEHEPKLRSWLHLMRERDFSEVKLKTGTALAPENGYLIVTNRLKPTMPNAHGMFEIQALVNAGRLGPDVKD